MPRKLATQCGVVWCRVKIQRPSLTPPQIAQSPAAKMFDQKGSTAPALESRRSVKFPASDAPQVCHTSFLCKCVVSNGTSPNFWMSFKWAYMEFWWLLIWDHGHLINDDWLMILRGKLAIQSIYWTLLPPIIHHGKIGLVNQQARKGQQRFWTLL